MNRPLCRGTTKAGAPCKRKAAAGSAYCGGHGGNTRPIGRPLKLNHDLIDTIVKTVELGVTWDVAAQAAGVHTRTLLEWRQRGEDDFETGQSTIFAELHRGLTRAVAVGEARLVQRIHAHSLVDWRAAAFILKCRHPERWTEHSRVEVAEALEPRTVTPEPSKRDAILELLSTATKPPTT